MDIISVRSSRNAQGINVQALMTRVVHNTTNTDDKGVTFIIQCKSAEDKDKWSNGLTKQAKRR